MRDEICNKVAEYLNVDSDSLESTELGDKIRELCVNKLRNVVGLSCKLNFRNDFFTFFSSFVGQAVLNKLRVNYLVASSDLRVVRYDGINFVDETVRLLDQEDVDEAFLDAFNLADDNRDILYKIKIKA